MDLRAYYKSIRDLEQTISSPFVVVAGLNTPEGGRAGVQTEVTKHVAARLIVEGRARLTSEEESKVFYAEQAEARREAEAAAAAQKMQVTIVGHSEIRQKPAKGTKE